MKASSRYFENHACQYYPCHEGQQEINCMFCYCPMYAYENCLGNPSFIERDGKRIKNCTKCAYPHQAEHYEDIISFLRAHMDLQG